MADASYICMQNGENDVHQSSSSTQDNKESGPRSSYSSRSSMDDLHCRSLQTMNSFFLAMEDQLRKRRCMTPDFRAQNRPSDPGDFGIFSIDDIPTMSLDDSQAEEQVRIDDGEVAHEAVSSSMIVDVLCDSDKGTTPSSGAVVGNVSNRKGSGIQDVNRVQFLYLWDNGQDFSLMQEKYKCCERNLYRMLKSLCCTNKEYKDHLKTRRASKAKSKANMKSYKT